MPSVGILQEKSEGVFQSPFVSDNEALCLLYFRAIKGMLPLSSLHGGAAAPGIFWL
jgi:hypothetical protein